MFVAFFAALILIDHDVHYLGRPHQALHARDMATQQYCCPDLAMSTSSGRASLNVRGKMAGPKAFHLEARSPVAWGRLFVNTSAAHTPACILGSNMPQKLL